MAVLSISRVSTNDKGSQTGNNAGSYQVSASSDGNLVAFNSLANNLIANDANNSGDVFVKDLTTGLVILASSSAAGVQGDNLSSTPSFSADGTLVAFQSLATNLVDGDTNGTMDIFIKNLITGDVQRVSTDTSGAQGNSDSQLARISADGHHIVFVSNATNLVAGDNNNRNDVFIKDLITGEVTLASSDATGNQGTGICYTADLSANGRFVVFLSSSNNLVVGDSNSYTPDIFVKDLSTGAIQLVAMSADGIQGKANGISEGTVISADGRYVVFQNSGDPWITGDTNPGNDIFVKDLVTGTLQLVSSDAHGTQGNKNSKNAIISADGQFVAFESDATNLVAGDTNNMSDVFIKDLATGAIRRVSTDTSGIEGNRNSGDSAVPAFSNDGKYLFFSSTASNLVSGDTNNAADIFRVVNPFFVSGGTGDSGGGSVNGSITSISSSVSYSLANGELNLTLTGIKAINGFGNALDNNLTGNNGNNILKGFNGDDYIDGSAGNDHINGGNGNDTIIGGDGNDTIVGGVGNDILDGGNGKDKLAGGKGDDIYYIGDTNISTHKANDIISENANDGYDRVISSISYSLVDNVEGLTLTGTDNITAIGNKSANTLVGNAGVNILNGKAGNDILTGGEASDVFVFDSALTTKMINGVLTPTNVDIITDFNGGSDYISLSKKVFTKAVIDTTDFNKSDGLALAASDLVSADSFDAAKIVQGNAHFLFDASTGALYYDSDGSLTKSAPIQFVTLTGVSSLAASDLHIM